MIRRIVAALFALLAIAAGSAGIGLALTHTESEPVLVEAPAAAREQALSMMDSLCRGDYGAVQQALYGRPELGLDTAPADAVGELFFEAYGDSLRYELLRDCYATDSGIALDVEVTALDVAGMLTKLRGRSQMLLEQRVAEAEDISEVYNENGEYLEELVTDVLISAARDILETESDTVTVAFLRTGMAL